MKHIVELKVAVLGYDTKEEAERDLRAHVAHGLAGAEVTVLTSRAFTPTDKQLKLLEGK
jgi:2-keto-3-deoxy-6-phosphogluconate aldolase